MPETEHLGVTITGCQRPTMKLESEEKPNNVGFLGQTDKVASYLTDNEEPSRAFK